MELIELKIETRGEVVSSNLQEFREAVTLALSTVNQTPETDEEFGQAELDVKALKNAESVVVEAKKQALLQADDLQKLFAALDDSSQEIRSARLTLENLISERKEKMRKALIDEAKSRIDCAYYVLSRFDAMIESAVKGKRSIASIREGLDKAVACANKLIVNNRKAIDEFVAVNGSALVSDREELEVRSCDIVTAELRRRLESFRAEEERKRLEEEVKRAKADALVAKKEAEKNDLPPPSPMLPSKPIFPQAVSQKGAVPETEEQELAGFRARVVSVFGGLRAAREALKHPGNIELVNEFAASVNEAFAKLKKGGSAQ